MSTFDPGNEPFYPPAARTRWQRFLHSWGCRGSLGACPEHGWLAGMTVNQVLGLTEPGLAYPEPPTIQEEP